MSNLAFVRSAEAERGSKEVAQLHQQLHGARKALDEAEALQGEAKDSKQKSSTENLAALRDKRRRLALQLKAAKDKVFLCAMCETFQRLI